MYIEEEDEQSLRLFITDIVATDAGEYECRGEVEGSPDSLTIKLDLFGECVVVVAAAAG